ncbi:LamG-like jellyroll fold domain-containing protein [Kitasatospora sp. NPDC057940]|uniref:LamG-like jellyroll fold domain-containing protein n=1 Tax=Kitasatospora sp. NPDC057940 TaxID=3346285 RepID=UPI0036DEC7D2
MSRLRFAAAATGFVLVLSSAMPAFADTAPSGTDSKTLTELMAAADAAHAKDRPKDRPADDTAFAQAKATGKNVLIDRLTTEFTETYATPDGKLQESRHPQQQRMKADGQWRPLDATLAARPGGGFAPRATPSGVVLSGGGNGPLATMTSTDGKKLALTAPFPLPAPQVQGDSLLYPAVVGADTDLKVTVGKAGSVSTVLIVKTAKAAADPALKNLHFGTVTDGVTITSDENHDLTASAADGPRWHAPAPRMWDSTPAVGAPNASTPQAPATGAPTTAADATRTGTPGVRAASFRAAAMPAADRTPAPSPTPSASPGAGGREVVPSVSTPEGPGAGAKVATMPVATTSSGIDLTPDQDILATGTAPYFIDPAWIPWANGSYGSTFVQSTHPGATHYNVNGPADSDHLGVGKCGSYPSAPSCNPADIERAYFQIDIRGLNGAAINSARLDFAEYISADWDCNKSYGVDLYLVDRPIDSGTNWNNRPQPIGGPIETAQVAGSGRGACHDNVPVTFWNVGPTVAQWVNNPWLTFGLQASDEGNAYAFKRFDYGATLTVTYDRTPNTPTNPYAYPVPHTADPARQTQGCNNDSWGWLGAGSDLNGAVTLNATVSSPVQGQLYSWSHIWDYTLAGVPDVDSGFSPLVNNGDNAAFTVNPNVVKDGHLYGYSIMAGDQLVGLSGSTPVCRFGVDLTPPRVSVLGVDNKLDDNALATQFPPSGNGQTTKIRTWQTGYVPVTVTDPTPNGGAASGVKCLRWSWDPQLAGAGWQCGGAMPTGGIPVMAGHWGTNILFIQAQDDAGNVSPVTQYAFYVPWNPDGPPPVFGDITGDGAPDIVTYDGAGNLRAYNVPGNSLAKSPTAALAALPADSPTGSWTNGVQFTHRGTLTGGKNVDDLIVHPAGGKDLYLYGNPGNTGYSGRFDSKAVLAKPNCSDADSLPPQCAPGTYATDWSTTLQVASLGDPAHSDLDTKLQFKNQTGLLTVESTGNGSDAGLWFYPATGAQTLGAPVQLAASGWKDLDLLTPGDWAGQGHPGLWTRNHTTGDLRAYTFTTGTYAPTHDGEPVRDEFGNPISVPTVTAVSTAVPIGSVPVATWPVLGSDGDLTGNGAPTLWGRNADGRIQIWWGHRTGDPTHPTFAWDVGPETAASAAAAPSWWAMDGRTEKIVDSSINNPLSPSGAPTRTADHNNVAGAATALNGSSYYKTKQSPGIDTTRSYSVAAWAKINNTNGFRTIVSQTGNQRSPFYLQYSASFGRWSFILAGEDRYPPAKYYTVSDTAAPQVGVWTHLVGTYNADTQAITLYVNGQAVGTTKVDADWHGWTADGPLTIGAETAHQLPDAAGLDGAVSDVRLYPYAVTDQQANNLATGNASVHVQSAFAYGKCVDDWGGGSTGAAVAIYDCWNGANQHFTFTPDNTMTVNGKCVGTQDNASANGAKVVLRDCNPAEGGQQWLRRYDGSLYNPQSGRCLELPGWAINNGTQLGIWDCHGGANQRWTYTAQLTG